MDGICLNPRFDGAFLNFEGVAGMQLQYKS